MAFKLLLQDDVNPVRKRLGPTIRSGQVAITNGVATITGTYSSVMPNTSYALTVQMLNSTDANPQFQPITITSKTASGFTAKWNANADSANYILDYVAIGNQ